MTDCNGNKRGGVVALCGLFLAWSLLTLPLSAQTATPAPTPTFPPPVWQTLAPGFEQTLHYPPDSDGAQLYILRIDPAYFVFRVHYRSGNALDVEGWRALLPDAVALVNGSFFDANAIAEGLVVADGIIHGESLDDRGGMFVVRDDVVRVRSNVREPYAGEALEQALQAYPMLVLDGRAVYRPTEADQVTRRTVIAQDVYHRILLITTPGMGIHLSDLARYLPTTDLGIRIALNLDGGTSALLAVASSQATYNTIHSHYPVPVVLAVYPRYVRETCTIALNC
jgi:hypothetical protein